MSVTTDRLTDSPHSQWRRCGRSCWLCLRSGRRLPMRYLLYALGKPVMVVDEYLRRVTVRHAIVPPFVEIEVWRITTAGIVCICIARRPRNSAGALQRVSRADCRGWARTTAGRGRDAPIVRWLPCCHRLRMIRPGRLDGMPTRVFYCHDQCGETARFFREAVDALGVKLEPLPGIADIPAPKKMRTPLTEMPD